MISRLPSLSENPVVAKLARTMGGPSQEVISIGRLLRSALVNFRALDLGSGAGRNSLYLAGQGAQVTAVDSSSTLIEALALMARSAGVSVDTVYGRVEDFSMSGDYNLILCHGILHFLPTNTALDLLVRLKAATASAGVHIITVAQYEPSDEVPASFSEQGYVSPGNIEQWQNAYRDWRCLALERYVKRDHHPGEGHHIHPICKMIFQGPGSPEQLLVSEPHRLDDRPRPDVRAFLLADELLQTTKRTVVDKLGQPDFSFVYSGGGPQLSFAGLTDSDYELTLLFWSKHAAYFENDVLVGYSQFQTDHFHTFTSDRQIH